MTFESGGLPVSDCLGSRLLDAGKITPEIVHRFEFMNGSPSSGNQLQSDANLILIPMTAQASDVGHLGLSDLPCQPDELGSRLGQKPTPRGKAARSMIGNGIHVMPYYLA